MAHKFQWGVSGLFLVLCGAGALADVVIEGVSGESRKNVEAHLTLSREPCDAPEWKIRRLYAQADDEIRKALEVYGYYGADLIKTLELTGECWSAQFNIDPGSPVSLQTVTVEIRGPGQQDERFKALMARNPLQTGAPLDHIQYERYKKEIADLAARRGYLDGSYLTSRIRVDPDRLTADITLIFLTGERYRFGPVIIDQEVVDSQLIERFVDFTEGMPYDTERLTSLHEALLISDYFDTLDIRTAPRKEPNRDVQVTIRGTESRARTFTGGIGFGTDTGPKLRAGYRNRRRNKAGHQSGVSASISPVISEIGLNYRLPLEYPKAEWLNFDTGYRYEDTDTSRSKQAKFGIKRLQNRRGTSWLETDFVEIAYEDFDVGDTSGTSFLLVPGISWAQVVTAGPPRPSRGHRLNVQFSGTAKAIGSSVSFLQVDVVGKLIRPLWSSARIIARSEGGLTTTNNFSDMPASRRYFAGGDFSVRGYDYQSLGPKDNDGLVIGGENLLTGSLELDQSVADKWSVALFADAGNAFDDFDDINLKFGVGAGLRWYSPLGPIRLDLAIPLADDAPDSFRIHITLGPDL